MNDNSIDAYLSTTRAAGDVTQLARPAAGPSNYSLAMLLGLSNDRRKHVYAGTVPAATVAARRKAGKAARASRKLNRR